MALFKSGNPTLSEKIFNKSMATHTDNTMTVRGTLNKFSFLLVMVIASASYVWHLFENRQDISLFIVGGAIGGLIIAIVLAFKPVWSGYLAPLYALLEGLFVGGISAYINEAMADSYPNIVMQAVVLTFGVAISMFLLYNFRVIKATERFKSVVMTATMGIAFFYLIAFVLSFFNIDIPFLHQGGWMGIGFSLFVVAIAALNLIMDFDRIEQGSEMGAPKFMEWYGAFGLMVTIVWLYIEILRLLSKLGSRD